MEDGGDAVADRLPVAVDERHIDGKINARAGHHLTFESIAMQIDDARQHQQSARIERERILSDGSIGFANLAVRDR